MSLARLLQPRALRGLPVSSEAPAPAQASEASRAPDVASDSDSEWDALLDAHGLTPPPAVAAAAVAQPADSAGAGRRARDKRRRRLRKAAKRSMWREILTPSLSLARHVASARGVVGSGSGPGCEHFSEDHGVELADLVSSCVTGAGRGVGSGLFWRFWRWTWRGRSWESCP